jgi:hypothetical protein
VTINDENIDDIVYGDEDKCDLLDKYFSRDLLKIICCGMAIFSGEIFNIL